MQAGPANLDPAGARRVSNERTLSHEEARSFYDGFGKKQDWQAFYESAAIEDLLGHAQLDQARSVFELGCGTGRLAARLLGRHLPAHATYVGVDVSPTMVGIAREAVKAFEKRASVSESPGPMRFSIAAESVDRFLSCYVLDLLAVDEIRSAFAEAARIVVPGGLLCLVSLTEGTTILARLVTHAWRALFRIRPSLVGGCRPVGLLPFLDDSLWSVQFHTTRISFGVPSEVLVALRR